MGAEAERRAAEHPREIHWFGLPPRQAPANAAFGRWRRSFQRRA
jgi:hypothetical protein